MLFHSTDPKRLVLIVEDEEINRNILNEILKDTYTLVWIHIHWFLHPMAQKRWMLFADILTD